MHPSGYFVDTNLLVLFVVGWMNPKLISQHRRTRSYTEDDYDKLRRMLCKVRRILITPSILTETSNLFKKDKVMHIALREFVLSSSVEEVAIESQMVVQMNEFERLGLTDCGLLREISSETPLLTDDFDLAREACKLGSNCAIVFRNIEIDDM